MTRRDVIALIRAMRHDDTRPTVELIRNARGVNIGVKVSARSVRDAGRKAQAEFDRLAALYPAPKNGDHEH